MKILEMGEELNKLQILTRVNNLLLSRFILQLSKVRDELQLPKRNTFFKFEILQSDYENLISEYGQEETDRALYRLDRTLLLNKQECPNNIKKYIVNYIKKNQKRRAGYNKHKKGNESINE